MIEPFISDAERAALPTLDREALDALDFGVVQVDRDGKVLEYNRYEQDLAGISRATALEHNFFTELAVCTNNRLFHGRFKKAMDHGETLNFVMPYTFTYKMHPTNVLIHMLRDETTDSNWILVKRR